MFSSVAFAQEVAGAAAEPSPIAGLMPIILMIVLFYFLLIRPQQKKLNDHKKMVSALRRGDKILTNGGIFGTIAKVEEDVIQVEIAPEVKVKIEKNAVSTVITRSEPADMAVQDSATAPQAEKKPAAKNAVKSGTKAKASAAKSKVKAND